MSKSNNDNVKVLSQSIYSNIKKGDIDKAIKIIEDTLKLNIDWERLTSDLMKQVNKESFVGGSLSSGNSITHDAKRLVDNMDTQKKMAEEYNRNIKGDFKKISELTRPEDPEVSEYIDNKILSVDDKVEDTTFLNAYGSLNKFYELTKMKNPNTDDIKNGLSGLLRYIMAVDKPIHDAVTADPRSIYETNVIRVIRNDISDKNNYLKKLDAPKLISMLTKEYENINKQGNDPLNNAKYAINIKSIVDAINDLTVNNDAKYGGSQSFVTDPIKVRLAILAIYTKINTLYETALRIKNNRNIDSEQETFFVQTVARIEEYLKYENVRHDMLFRISPIQSVLYARIVDTVEKFFAEYKDPNPDIKRYLTTIIAAIEPLKHNNSISSGNRSDIIVDININSIDLDERVFRLIREISYVKSNFVDTKYSIDEINRDLKHTAIQFRSIEEEAIKRAGFNADITDAVSGVSNASIQMDYMTQMMNHEATSERADVDSIFNALFRSRNHLKDSLTYPGNINDEINNLTTDKITRVDALRAILPEIDNSLNIFARVTGKKSKHFQGPKAIADLIYKYIACESDVAFIGAPSVTFKKTDELDPNLTLGNILKLFMFYNSEGFTSASAMSNSSVYSEFAEFNKQNGFGGSYSSYKPDEAHRFEQPIKDHKSTFGNLHGDALKIMIRSKDKLKLLDSTFDPSNADFVSIMKRNEPNDKNKANLEEKTNPCYLITLPLIISQMLSGNYMLAPLLSRMIFGQNVFIENFCNTMIAVGTERLTIFTPRDENLDAIYDFRNSKITCNLAGVISRVDGISIEKNPTDSAAMDRARVNTEKLINSYLSLGKLSYASQIEFDEDKNLIFLIMHHFISDTDINAQGRGGSASMNVMMEKIKSSRVCTEHYSLVSDENIVSMYYSLCIASNRYDPKNKVYTDEGVSFKVNVEKVYVENRLSNGVIVERVNKYERLISLALEKIIDKYGIGRNNVPRFDALILNAKSGTDYVTQNILQVMDEVNSGIPEEYNRVSENVFLFAKTFGIDNSSQEGKNLINNVLHTLHKGDKSIIKGASVLKNAVYTGITFDKHIFMLWNQYQLLDSIYINLSSSPSPMDLLLSDINTEIKKSSAPPVFGDEKTTIMYNIFSRYVAMMKMINGRIFSVIDKNLIDVNSTKSSVLERYKLGVSELFGGANFTFDKNRTDQYIRFILLAEWYFTFFKSKNMYDIKPYILKESSDFNGLNEVVYAKVFDNTAYTDITMNKVIGVINQVLDTHEVNSKKTEDGGIVESPIQMYIKIINRALGFYIFNAVDKVEQKNNSINDKLSTLSSTATDIFNGIPTNLPLNTYFDDDKKANIRSRFDIDVNVKHNNISNVYERNKKLVNLFVDVNSGFENVDFTQHDNFTLRDITSVFKDKVNTKTTIEAATEFVSFMNNIDSFEYANKTNILTNFIETPLKIAENMMAAFEDDFNEVATLSNFSKMKNIIVGNGVFFGINTDNKKVRFTSSVPSYVNELLQFSHSSMLKYSNNVDYGTVGTIEKRINTIRDKVKHINDKLNSSEFSEKLLINMFPQVINEMYRDIINVSAFEGTTDADGKKTPPDWFEKNKKIASRGAKIKAGVYDYPKTHQDELDDIQTVVDKLKKNHNNEKVTDSFVDHVSKLLSTAGTKGVFALEMRIVLNSIKSFLKRVYNNLVYFSRVYLPLDSALISGNKKDIQDAVVKFRQFNKNKTNKTDHMYLDFYTDSEIVSKLMEVKDRSLCVFTDSNTLEGMVDSYYEYYKILLRSTKLAENKGVRTEEDVKKTVKELEEEEKKRLAKIEESVKRMINDTKLNKTALMKNTREVVKTVTDKVMSKSTEKIDTTMKNVVEIMLSVIKDEQPKGKASLKKYTDVLGRSPVVKDLFTRARAGYQKGDEKFEENAAKVKTCDELIKLSETYNLSNLALISCALFANSTSVLDAVTNYIKSTIDEYAWGDAMARAQDLADVEMEMVDAQVRGIKKELEAKYENEKNELKNKYDELLKTKDSEIADVIAERDNAISSNPDIEKIRAEIAAEMDAAKAEAEVKRKEAEAARAETEAVKKELESSKKETEAAKAETAAEVEKTAAAEKKAEALRFEAKKSSDEAFEARKAAELSKSLLADARNEAIKLRAAAGKSSVGITDLKKILTYGFMMSIEKVQNDYNSLNSSYKSQKLSAYGIDPTSDWYKKLRELKTRHEELRAISLIGPEILNNDSILYKSLLDEIESTNTEFNKLLEQKKGNYDMNKMKAVVRLNILKHNLLGKIRDYINVQDYSEMATKYDKYLSHVDKVPQGFALFQQAEAPFGVGTNTDATTRRGLTEKYGPHMNFLRLYNIMVILQATTNDQSVKDLMKSLASSSVPNNLFSQYKKISSIDQVGGSMASFSNTKDLVTVNKFGDFTSAIDFKTTDFNRIRLAELLNKAIMKEMIGVMSVHQRGFNGSKNESDSVADIVYKASVVCMMLRESMTTLIGSHDGLFDYSTVDIIKKGVGDKSKYTNYESINIDVLCSKDNVFGTPVSNEKEASAAIDFIGTINKQQSEKMKNSCMRYVNGTPALYPGATLVMVDEKINVNKWLHERLPMSLYTYTKEELASISDRMNKFIVYLQALLGNIYRVFGKGSRFKPVPCSLPGYESLLAYISSRVGSAKNNDFSVVDTPDVYLTRMAEALLVKSRIINIQTHVQYKNAYAPAELVIILNSEFLIDAPETVKCKRTVSDLTRLTSNSVVGTPIKEIFLMPGESTASVVTIQREEDSTTKNIIAKELTPASAAAINDMKYSHNYQFRDFDEMSSVEALLAKSITRKLSRLLSSKFPCSIYEYVSTVNSIGILLANTKSTNTDIYNYIMSRIKSNFTKEPKDTVRELIGKYAELLHDMVDDAFGGAYNNNPPVVYAAQNPQERISGSRFSYLENLHNTIVAGPKAVDLGKGMKDYEKYITKYDAANNLPALYNACEVLYRSVNSIIELSDAWLVLGVDSPVKKDVLKYISVCREIRDFCNLSMNVIATYLKSATNMIGETLKDLIRSSNNSDLSIKKIYDVVTSDVHAILPRSALVNSQFAYMSPVFNAIFYSQITKDTTVIPQLYGENEVTKNMISHIINIANNRLAKNTIFGKKYITLDYDNVLSSESQNVSRNMLHLNNIKEININPIKLSYMKQTPLFYATEVFSRVFDRSVKEYITKAYSEFTDAEKGVTYRTNLGDITLKANYSDLVDFLTNPLDFVRTKSEQGRGIVLPEEFKHGITRGREVTNNNVYGHYITDAVFNSQRATTNILYFWTKEVYKFMRNFVVDRLSRAGETSDIGSTRGLNSLIRNEHIFK